MEHISEEQMFVEWAGHDGLRCGDEAGCKKEMIDKRPHLWESLVEGPCGSQRTWHREVMTISRDTCRTWYGFPKLWSIAGPGVDIAVKMMEPGAVVIVKDAVGRIIVIDGNHRLSAALRSSRGSFSVTMTVIESKKSLERVCSTWYFIDSLGRAVVDDHPVGHLEFRTYGGFLADLEGAEAVR